jgi:hypothetical protein
MQWTMIGRSTMITVRSHHFCIKNHVAMKLEFPQPNTSRDSGLLTNFTRDLTEFLQRWLTGGDRGHQWPADSRFRWVWLKSAIRANTISLFFDAQADV